MDLLSVVVGIGLVLFFYFVVYSKPQDDEWKKLPSFEEYLDDHPECETDDVKCVTCFSCGSDTVDIVPVTTDGDPRQKHVCSVCQKALFKSKGKIWWAESN
ncbi:hypothetical protein LRP49_07315 [Enterovibrio sp. ZSDZ35]|uniref:Double zinc ribbon n=1 Tax=Enterovibrio qingdaonensis TaxID=2899818 RepID=A0ABT5QJ42_9GAMM|nr:hypothetical protein [Enterovibrio sp. ZSDZ35]MDD1781010.1 hypothetical protein [Enterovibrio sp. ZSDZ35]